MIFVCLQHDEPLDQEGRALQECNPSAWSSRGLAGGRIASASLKRPPSPIYLTALPTLAGAQPPPPRPGGPLVFAHGPRASSEDGLRRTPGGTAPQTPEEGRGCRGALKGLCGVLAFLSRIRVRG